jgi:hypothetical protein
LFNTSPSVFYHIFVLVCYVCSYSTILAMSMHLYHRIEDMDEAMDVAMFILISAAENCTQLYFR